MATRRMSLLLPGWATGARGEAPEVVCAQTKNFREAEIQYIGAHPAQRTNGKPQWGFPRAAERGLGSLPAGARDGTKPLPTRAHPLCEPR